MASKKGIDNPIERKNEKRNLNKAKKNFKRGKQTRKPRPRDWDENINEETFDAGFERIMPLDEQERRRAVVTLLETTPTDETEMITTTDESTGLVIEVSSGMCRVIVDERVLLCRLRGNLMASESGFTNVISVGDRVTFTGTGEGEAVVDAVMPRRTYIARPDPAQNHLKQLLVANVDQLLIVAAWRNPGIWYELIDRYLITAERSTIKPIICVNKVDLAEDMAQIYAETAPYEQMGYTVLLTSAEQGIGLDVLHEHLSGKITALAGLSGVGKSSLLSAVHPGFDLRTGNVNEERGQGRHTTTQATMLPFEDGYVIDTPGIREFGLAGLHRSELPMYYPEILKAAMSCKFADCTHTHEPDCGVQDALAAGQISETRYHSFTVIADDLPE